MEKNIKPTWHYEKPRQTERERLQGGTFKARKKKKIQAVSQQLSALPKSGPAAG